MNNKTIKSNCNSIYCISYQILMSDLFPVQIFWLNYDGRIRTCLIWHLRSCKSKVNNKCNILAYQGLTLYYYMCIHSINYTRHAWHVAIPQINVFSYLKNLFADSFYSKIWKKLRSRCCWYVCLLLVYYCQTLCPMCHGERKSVRCRRHLWYVFCRWHDWNFDSP